MKDNVNIPINDKLLLTVDEAALYTNIGQNRLSELLRKPMCPFVLYVGRKKLIKRKELEKYLSDSIEI